MMRIKTCALVALAVLAAVAVSAASATQPTPKAVMAPVQTVRVQWGSIGYRVVGQGRPLVLLAGVPGNIDDWPPSLIDALAGGARVYAMDYEGAGRTAVRGIAAKITVTRLADDTADFIRALHLAPADVMGWSFGSLVAQSLAIRHPTLVRRLVLAATALGDGSAALPYGGNTPSPPSNYKCKGSGDWWAVFPYNAKGCAAAVASARAIRTYPDYAFEAHVSAAVTNAEGNAAAAWLSGQVREGYMAAKIAMPVLVGDGSLDVQLPMHDSVNVAKTIPHATLKLYPDAAHAFLIQHAADWSRLVLHFLNSG